MGRRSGVSECAIMYRVCSVGHRCALVPFALVGCLLIAAYPDPGLARSDPTSGAAQEIKVDDIPLSDVGRPSRGDPGRKANIYTRDAYAPPAFNITDVLLDFLLDETETRVCTGLARWFPTSFGVP